MISATHLTHGNGNGAVNTASISPAANKLILVTLGFYAAGTITLPTSVQGNGITYTLVTNTAAYATPGDNKVLALYRGMSASPTSGAITSTGGSFDFAAWVVDQVDGVKTSGSNGANAVRQFALNQTNSATSLTAPLVAFGNDNNGAYGCAFNYAQGDYTPIDTGWTEIYDGHLVDEPQTQYRASNDTTPTWNFPSDACGAIAIELVDATSPILVRGATFAGNEVAGPVNSRATAAFNCTAGRLLVGMIGFEAANVEISTISDLAGNTWVKAPAAISSAGDGANVHVFWCLNSLPHASNVITVTLTGNASFVSVGGCEYYMDVQGSWALDDNDSNNGTTGTTWTSPSVALIGKPQPVIAILLTTSVQNFTDNEYDLVTNMGAAGRGFWDRLITDGTTPIAPNIQWDAATDWAAANYTFKFLGVSAVVGGTAGDGATESEIVAGGQTITLTLSGDTFIPN